MFLSSLRFVTHHNRAASPPWIRGELLAEGKGAGAALFCSGRSILLRRSTSPDGFHMPAAEGWRTKMDCAQPVRGEAGATSLALVPPAPAPAPRCRCPAQAGAGAGARGAVYGPASPHAAPDTRRGRQRLLCRSL